MASDIRFENLRQRLRTLLLVFERAGIPVYPVGGCVRDTLLGRPVEDIDLTTPVEPQTVKSLFRRVVDTGLKHGTVTVLLDGERFEVTTFRTDTTYSNGRHPDSVRFGVSLQEDLGRRDFTVNAAAWNPTTNTLVDPFGASADCVAGVLRAVGNPEDRFFEDALRIFRIFRFQSQLGFRIEGTTLEAANRFSPRTTLLSAERIRSEWEKTLLGTHWHRARNKALEAGLLSEHGMPGHWPLASERLVLVPQPAEGRWAWHFLDCGMEQEASVQNHLLTLKFSRQEADTILKIWRIFTLVRMGHRDPDAFLDLWASRENLDWIGWFSVFLPQEEAGNLVARVRGRAGSPIPLSLSELRITGGDLIRLGFQPGPSLGWALKALLAWARLQTQPATYDQLQEQAEIILATIPAPPS